MTVRCKARLDVPSLLGYSSADQNTPVLERSSFWWPLFWVLCEFAAEYAVQTPMESQHQHRHGLSASVSSVENGRVEPWSAVLPKQHTHIAPGHKHR